MQLQTLRRIGQWTKPPVEAHNSHHPRDALPSADELEARLPGMMVVSGMCTWVVWEMRNWRSVVSGREAALVSLPCDRVAVDRGDSSSHHSMSNQNFTHLSTRKHTP
jgi:hypothetical protein